MLTHNLLCTALLIHPNASQTPTANSSKPAEVTHKKLTRRQSWLLNWIKCFMCHLVKNKLHDTFTRPETAETLKVCACPRRSLEYVLIPWQEMFPLRGSQRGLSKVDVSYHKRGSWADCLNSWGTGTVAHPESQSTLKSPFSEWEGVPSHPPLPAAVRCIFSLLWVPPAGLQNKRKPAFECICVFSFRLS